MERYLDLMVLAQQQTGLCDFGEDTFREGLERLTGSLNTEARLNAAGDHALRDKILLHLRQRLEIEEWYRRHPEIDEVEIRAPLFGVSLPRTGSTALSFLLSSDPEIRYLRVWESSQPCPPPSTIQGPDPRRGEHASEADRAASTHSHTPTGIDGAMECQDLMSLDFRSQIFQALAKIPSYSQWLLDTDLRSTYRYERRVLKLLQWREPSRPWRLKAPSHLLYLDALDEAFPDARFVMTHRDPTDVLVSVSMIYADLASHFTDHVDPLYIGDLMVDTWSRGVSRALEFRARGNDERFCDIHFTAMKADPVGEVRRLYGWLGEKVTPQFAQAMTAWWETNARNHEPGGKSEPIAFGLDLASIRSIFADYVAKVSDWTGVPPV